MSAAGQSRQATDISQALATSSSPEDANVMRHCDVRTRGQAPGEGIIVLPTPNVKKIFRRLECVDFQDWGPDQTRYVCILFWNQTGYRLLRNTINTDTWNQWDKSSGQAWDLHLAGCSEERGRYGDERVLIENPGVPVYWSYRQSRLLAHEIVANARRHSEELKHSPELREFTGPIELVTIGARRRRIHNPESFRDRQGDIEIDWASLRTMPISEQVASRLGEAITYYTEAHVMLDASILPENLPAPGDFHDDLPRELLRDAAKRGSFVGKIFRRTLGG
jgi:hypothetical protein